MTDYNDTFNVSESIENQFFIKIAGTSRLNLFMVDNVANALSIAGVWQKIFESPKTGEPSGERGSDFTSVGRRLDFPVIVNESNSPALIDMFFVGHTDTISDYYPAQTNVYQDGSIVAATRGSFNIDVAENALSNVGPWSSLFRGSGGSMFVFQLDSPGGIDGTPAGSIPGLKYDENWEWVSDTSADMRLLAFPLTDSHIPSRSGIGVGGVYVTVKNETTGYVYLDEKLIPHFEIPILTVNYKAWYFDDPNNFDESQFDEDNLSPPDFLEDFLFERSMSNVTTTILYFCGLIRTWEPIDSWNGFSSSQKQDFHDIHDEFVTIANANANSSDRITMTVRVPGNNQTHTVDTDDPWAVTNPGFSNFQKLSDAGQYKKADGSPTQWQGEWDSSKSYNAGDIVAVDFSNTSPLSDFSNYKTWYYYARAKQAVGAGGERPLTNDHPDPTSVIAGKTPVQVYEELLPFDTTHWKCLNRNIFSAKAFLTSVLGLPFMSKTFTGTDIKVLSYSGVMTPGFSAPTPSGSDKSYEQYIGEQRYFLNENTIRDFGTYITDQDDVDNGVSGQVGELLPKFKSSILYDSSNSITQRLAYRIPSRDFVYSGTPGPGDLTSGGWPGSSSAGSSWLDIDAISSNYMQGGQSICFPITHALKIIKSKGGTLDQWINSSDRSESWKDITFSQSTEFESSSRLPEVSIGITASHTPSDETTFFWNNGGIIPLRHRGVKIPLYIKAQVVGSSGLYVNPSSSNSITAWITALSDSTDSNLRGLIFNDTDGLLFNTGYGNSTETADIYNNNANSIKNETISSLYTVLREASNSVSLNMSGFSTYVSGTSNEVLSDDIELGDFYGGNPSSLGTYKLIGYVQFPAYTGASYTKKYISSLVTRDVSGFLEKTRLMDFLSDDGLDNVKVVSGSGELTTRSQSISLKKQLSVLNYGLDLALLGDGAFGAPDGMNEYIGGKISDNYREIMDNEVSSASKFIASAVGSGVDGYQKVVVPGEPPLLGILGTGTEDQITEYANTPITYSRGKYLNNTNFHVSPLIVIDQPSLVDHQNVKFYGHAPGSYIRTKSQRISPSNKFYIYPDVDNDHKFGWRIKLPLNDYKSGGSRYIGPYQTDPTLTFYKNGTQTYTKIIPDGAAVITADLLDVNKTNFNGLAENDVVGIEFYDGIPDEEDAGRKRIDATVDILTYPTVSAIQNQAPSNTLYYYGGDDTEYSITPIFPHHSDFGSIIRLSKNETTDYFEYEYGIGDSISAITYNPNDLDGNGALGGAQLVVSMDDGAIFGPGKSRGNSFGSLENPINMPYIYRGDYTWTNSDPQVNEVMVNYAYDVFQLTPPNFIEYPENYKGSKFWVYDGTGISSGISYGGGQVSASSWNSSTPDSAHFKSESTLTASGTGVSDPSVGLSTTDGTFSMNRAQFASDGQNSTIEFFDGFPVPSNNLSKVSLTAGVKEISPPSISNLTLDYIGQYKLWPSSSITIGSGDLTLSADVFSESDFATLKIKNLSGASDQNLHSGTINQTIQESLSGDLVGDSTNLEIQDNIKNNGDLSVSASISSPDIVVVQPELPKPISMQIKYESQTGTKFWRKMGSFPHMFNKIHQDSTNSPEGDYFNSTPSINRRGFLTSHIGSNMRDTFYSPMRNIIVPVNKNDTTTEVDFMLDDTTLGAEADYSYYNMGGSDPSNDFVKTNVHGSRILFDPDRRGIDEPNLWTSQSSVDADQWGITSTYRGGGKCIDISPNATANLIFDESTKFLGGTHKNTPGASNHGDGVDDVDADDHDYKIWSPVNYQGLNSWEEIGRRSSSGSGTPQNEHWWHNVWDRKMSNVTFMGTQRLMGWRISNPHGSAVSGKSSTFADTSNPSVVLIENGSPAWGSPQPQKCWSTMGEGDTIIDIIGTQTKGCIGLQNARRITKIVNGVFPGVTYRLYISLAYRKTGTDNSQSPYGPTGARVYVVEPHQAEDETTDITNELIAYGEFTPNACRSIDYNQSNMVGADGKQTNFARSDPYDKTNIKEGSTNVATGGQYNQGDPANDHSLVEPGTSDGGFKLFYVEFTPTRGANCVEIRIESAFVADCLGQIQAPASWTKVEQSKFFNYRWNEGAAGAPHVNSFRKNWTEYHGAWAGNGFTSANYSNNSDQTVFIGSVFIKPTRPLWIEKIKVASEPAQGGFQLMLTSGDPAISPCYNYFVKAPWASGDIISQMISDNQCSNSLNGVLNSKSTGGWFDSSLGSYELEVIRQHTHLYLWDPWAIDMDNHATVYGCQNKMYDPSSDPPTGYKNDDGHHAVPNLITGNYIGHACWWEGRLWRLKSTYRDTNASGFVRRPGYDGWQWNDDVFQYMPTVTASLNGGSLKWDNLTNWTAQEFVQDAANETPGGLYFITGAVNAVDQEDARFQADWNTGEVADGFSHFSQSHGFWYSGHVLDAILRRPFRSTYEIYFPKWFAKNGYGGLDNSTNHFADDPPYNINTQSFIEFNGSTLNWYNVNGLSLYLPPTSTQESVFYNENDHGYVYHADGGWMFFTLKSPSARYLSYTSGLYIYETSTSTWKYRFDLSPLYPYTDTWQDTDMISSNTTSPALMDPDEFKIDTPLISGDDARAIVGHSMEVDFSMCVGALNTYSIISSDKDNIKEPSSFPVFKHAFHRRHMSLTDDDTKTNPSIADHIYGSISPICIESIAEMFSNGGYYSNHSDGYEFQSWYNTRRGWQAGGYLAGQPIPPGFSFPYFNSSHWLPYNPWKTSSVEITGATSGRKKTLVL